MIFNNLRCIKTNREIFKCNADDDIEFFVKQIITPINIKRKSRKLSHTHDEDSFERRRVECELINRQYSYYPPLKDNIAVWERLDCTTRPPDILDEGTYVPF